MSIASYFESHYAERGLMQRNGTWFPIGHDHKLACTFRSAPDMQYAVQRCDEKRVAIQAGGCVGAWASWLAHRFDRVLTFEPDRVNYEALVLNCEKQPNVIAMQAALTANDCMMRVRRDEKNPAHHRVEDWPGSNDVPAMKIDSLGLKICDLIVLDIEGHEFNAIAGAMQLISQCSPVIHMRDLGHARVNRNYARNMWDVLDLLPYGYVEVKNVAHDIVLWRKHYG